MTDYDAIRDKIQKALDTLNVKVSIKFKKLGLYFDTDTETRNIYTVTLTRPRTGKDRGYITARFSFGDSVNATRNNDKPGLLDVFPCLVNDWNCGRDAGTVDNFAREYGYTPGLNGQTVAGLLRAYNGVKRNKAKMERIFYFSELLQLTELCQDC